MKKRWKITLGIAAAIVLLAPVINHFLMRSDYVRRLRERRFLVLSVKDAQQRRVLLLCKTDHEALLKAGREILNQIPEDYLDTDGKRVAGVLHLPKGVQIPETIQDIRPRGFFVDYDGYLIMEMHGGMTHFGVRIYPEDYKEPDRYFKYVDRELLPGLWYYDDGYIHNPEYDKRIEKLIDENRRKH